MLVLTTNGERKNLNVGQGMCGEGIVAILHIEEADVQNPYFEGWMLEGILTRFTPGVEDRVMYLDPKCTARVEMPESDQTQVTNVTNITNTYEGLGEVVRALLEATTSVVRLVDSAPTPLEEKLNAILDAITLSVIKR